MTTEFKDYTTGDIDVSGVEVLLQNPVSRSIDEYNNFMSSIMTTAASNASAYISNRVATAQQTQGTTTRNAAVEQARKLSKILIGATFVPTYPMTTKGTGRTYDAGALGQVNYFVFHRPISFGDLGGKVYIVKDEAGQVRAPGASLRGLMQTFAAPQNTNTSVHFLVGYGGELVQMLDLADASHGQPYYLNSIGVEMEGAIEEPMTIQQLRRVVWLVAITSQIFGFSIDKEHCRLHSEMDPEHRKDPGPLFPYEWVIKQAAALKASGTLPTQPSLWFQPPFSATDVYQQQLQKIVADAGQQTDPIVRDNLIAAVAEVNAHVRAAASREINRSTLAAAAVDFYQKGLAYSAKNLAGRTATGSVSLQQPAAQNAVVGLMYDFEKGLWNDGKQV